MKKLLLMAIMLVSLANVATAVQLEGDGVENLVQSVVYHPDDAEGTAYKNFSNKLEVVCNWNDILVANHKVNDVNKNEFDENIFWYTLNGKKYILGVEGVALQLRNLTQEPMTIEWAESRFQLGSYFGLPFLNGMKYMDAGNPEKIPSTVITAGETTEVYLWRGDPYIDFDWTNGYAQLRKDGALRALVSMKVVQAGGVAYYTFQTPRIVLPKYAYSSFLLD